jgi:hypothetical protein
MKAPTIPKETREVAYRRTRDTGEPTSALKVLGISKAPLTIPRLVKTSHTRLASSVGRAGSVLNR